MGRGGCAGPPPTEPPPPLPELPPGADWSVLAAVGTALPETMIPVVALIGAALAGESAGAAASAIAIVSVFNVFATLVMPVLGVVALLASGVVEGTYLLMAAIGILAIGGAVVAFAVSIASVGLPGQVSFVAARRWSSR